MALTHLIVDGFNHSSEVEKNYIDYYKKRASEGKWTILDNSAYEIGKLESTSAHGQGLGPDLVLKAAEIIKPSIVIAQDVLCDRQDTLYNTLAFIEAVKRRGLLGKFQIMAVAQGRTEDEWLRSYEDLVKIKEVDQIGFSKISIPLSFGGNQATAGCVTEARLKCTAQVDRYWGHSMFTKNRVKRAHLLGGDNHLPWELSQQKKYRWIFSNDSSASVQYGLYGKQYDPSTGKIVDIITEKPDLENNKKETVDLLNKHSDYILHNIAILHKMSK